MARYVRLSSQHETEQYTTDIKELASSVPIITLYFIIMPTCLMVFLKLNGAEDISKTTFKVISIYGYSFASFIPASFLYIIPINGFKWLLLFTAAAISLFFMAKEIIQVVRTNLDSIKPAAVVAAIAHFVFILMMKWKFLT
mmetsp:Transcript_25394/g.22537  ORF Transcript_25394/g.22537 Transcript_25394/m.22537 type:complete len:141 (+) Transcript_25394:542-964(+)